MNDGPAIDARMHAPATARNRDPILAVLREFLPARGLVLEIASGSGEHVVHFARALPALAFQPTDPSPQALASIAGWIADAGVTNVRAPLLLDAASGDWPVGQADAIVCINMIHIAPWDATEGLMRGAAQLLASGAPLVLYGPYRRGGAHTAPSNAAFDADLKGRNPQWGVRDLDEVAACARRNGFSGPQVSEMPANNLCVTFTKG